VKLLLVTRIFCPDSGEPAGCVPRIAKALAARGLGAFEHLMKILLASGVYPPRIGGPSAQTEQMARLLIEKGFELRVLTYGNPEESGLVRGVPVTFIRLDRALGRLFHNYRAICRVMGEFRPDVVQVQTIGGSLALLTGVAARLRRIPSVLKFSGDFVVEMTGGASIGVGSKSPRLVVRALGFVQYVLLKAYDCIWVTTPAFHRHLTEELRVPESKILEYPNCVDLRSFEAIAHARPALSKPIVLLTVVRLNAYKGADVCIEALDKLRDLPVKLQIVGGGTPDYERSLRDLVKRLDVEDRVEFVGSTPPDRIPSFFAAADIFLLASRYEPFGIVLLEAMAAGLPIVATNVGGIPAVVQNGVSARLVPPGDADALADAVRELVSHDALRLSLIREARKRVTEFSLESLLTVLSNAWRKLAKEPHSVLSLGCTP
jgi:glycosyltransferase involved in cell wall biosynthesis